jgi:hypothetical protein
MATPGDYTTTQYYARAEEFQRRAGKVKKTQPNPNPIPEAVGDLEEERFSERVVTEALPELFVPLEDVDRGHIGNCEINLGTLQRMNIHAIQRDLIRLTSEIVSSGRMTVRAPRAGPLPR